MLLKLQNVDTDEIIQEIEIAWGYVTTYKGKTYVRYISKENDMKCNYQFEQMNLENDNVMVHILP